MIPVSRGLDVRRPHRVIVTLARRSPCQQRSS